MSIEPHRQLLQLYSQARVAAKRDPKTHTGTHTMSSSLVDLSQPWLYASVTTILFNPIFWNLVARNGQSRVSTLCPLTALS